MIFTNAAGRGGRGGRKLALVSLLLLGVLIAACSPAASASPSPSPSATETPTASPTAVATANPSPSPSVAPSAAALPDPAVGLKIDAPFTLAALDPVLETSFRQQFAASAGAFGSLIAVGGREVVSGGSLVGYVIVIGFPTGVMNDAVYEAMLGGIASSSHVTFKKATVSGSDVSTGSTGTAGLGVFRAGDHVNITVTPTETSVTAITTALITANQ